MPPSVPDARLHALLRVADLLDAADEPALALDALAAALAPGVAELALVRLDAQKRPGVAAVAELAALAEALRGAPDAPLPKEAGAALVRSFEGGALALVRRVGGFDAEDDALAAGLARRVEAALTRAAQRRRLLGAQERLDLLTEATDDVLWEHDVASGRGWRSARFAERYAPVPELPDGREDWLALVHPDDRERVGRRVAAALEGADGSWSDEYRILRKDGSWAVVVDRARIVRDASGRAARLVGAMQDVSRRREAEDAALLQKALLESQNEAALDGIFFQGVDGRTVFYNRRLLEMWGIDASVPQGERVEDRLAKVVHLLADPQGFIDKVLAMEKDRGATLRDDLRTADGRVFDCYAAPVRTREGAYAGRVWFYRDVTARRRMEEELTLARRHLAQSEKLAALGTLVSGVAHEIRTPLAYVSNQAWLVQRWAERVDPARPPGAEAVGQLREASLAISEGVERMNRLVTDLRRFSRIESGARAPLDVDEVVQAAVRLFEAAHPGRAKVEAGYASGAKARVDRVQLQQVVLNLLENAAEASPPGAGVRVRTWTEGGHAVLAVEDDGPGIPPEVRARMWEPFYTTKEEGTGLGLSIVRRIVESHHGVLRCESEPGKGARFVVGLPLTG